MVSISKAVSAKKDTKSIHSTIPLAITEYMSIKAGDTLEWFMQDDDRGDRIVVMRKSKY